MHKAYKNNTILLGDMNLDWNKKNLISYPFNMYCDYLENKMNELDFVQLVNFPTWSTMVNGTIRESTIDHVYTADPTSINNLYSQKPVFGDHVLILCCVEGNIRKSRTTKRRSWLNYSKESVCQLLSQEEWMLKPTQ
jgi:hypothetical protein